MKDILNRADAIRLTTPDIEKIRTLIFNTAEEKFVQLQLKAVCVFRHLAPSFLRGLAYCIVFCCCC